MDDSLTPKTITPESLIFLRVPVNSLVWELAMLAVAMTPIPAIALIFKKVLLNMIKNLLKKVGVSKL
jgi:hypothetical protein